MVLLVHLVFIMSNTGEHFWTADEGEAFARLVDGWTSEDVAFFSDDNMGVPVHRLWNGGEGPCSHHYTTDEDDVILSANTLLEMTPYYLPDSYGSTYNPVILRTFFRVFDQYGNRVDSSLTGGDFAPSYEVNLGDVNEWTVSKNDTTDCTIQGVNVDANKKNDFSVTATLENGMSATCNTANVSNL